MRLFLIIIFFSVFITLQYFVLFPYEEYNFSFAATQDSVVTAEVSFVGDLMCHSTQFNYAKVNADSFDFTGVYREVKKYLKFADLTIGNLETVIAGKEKGYSGYPFFNSPDDFVYALKDAGFDLIITANNHSLDQGAKGVERTIKVINEFDLNQTGTFTSQKDHNSIRVFDINSIKIAVLAYTENTNGIPIPAGKSYLINLIDENKIAEDINAARKSNADIVIVTFHFGTEYKRDPTDYQKDVVRKTIDAGADIIIGGHPHVIQPVDYFVTNGGKIDTGFVAYSLGNFISNQRWRYSDAGIILSIKISKNIFTDSVYLSGINYLPTWVFKGETEKGREYIILPSEITAEDTMYQFLSSNDKKLMIEAFEDTKYIISKYTDKIKLTSPIRDETAY
jgi:poly-gamma-glutamate synthesis protein (capsule biosynthesis protein)